ncbi:PhzF family phenazine biosynthesis protein [Pinisolibacter sp.]|mgnify:CR=1 FL=1|uniref:PhzF family phenazine biosynthesis protein n=1 Tax=Pinisolibacter sp. TaxID=2172024 RepID=UPI002FDE7635
MSVERIASFSAGSHGGNPAGVWIGDALPPAAEMQRIAAEVGYAETAFAARHGAAWTVRYFAPETEVPFCGHATIALGAALARRFGPGTFRLELAATEITVTGGRSGDLFEATLISPPTRSRPLEPGILADLLTLFGWSAADLDATIPPARIHGGSDHAVLTVDRRETLAAMAYDVEAGARLMRREGWITILLVRRADDRVFDVRNAFAAGGLVEDPATGAAAAAFAGYLRDLGHAAGAIDIRQGDDMGHPCRLRAEFDAVPGAGIRVSGTARDI